MKVRFYEAFKEEADALRRYLPPGIKADFCSSTIQENGDTDVPADIISIRTQSVIPSDWSGGLKAILSRSTGYDHLIKYRDGNAGSLEYGYLPIYCNRSVAEHAITLMLTLIKKIPQQIKQFSNFNRDGITGSEILGKNALVVGVGNIGIEIVKLLRCFGMNVSGCDLVHKHDDVYYKEFDDAIGSADVIFCAMNLNEKSRNYFTYEKLSRAKTNSIFINIARGDMSPATDLLQAINESRIAGAALDVFPEEELLSASLRGGSLPDHPQLHAVMELSRLPNVILTPHNAFNTEESVERKAYQSIQQILNFIEHGEFLWPVPSENGAV